MRSLLPALIVAWSAQAIASDSLDDVKGTVELMISSAYICSAYRNDPAILAHERDLGRGGLVGAGMTAAEADSFMDRVLDPIKGKPTVEAQRQAACMIIGIQLAE